MNFVITFLVFTTLLFATMAQHKMMDSRLGYIIAGLAGAIAMVLAFIRYKGRKDAGE